MPLPISIEEKEKLMHASLPFGKSFDAAERKLVIGEKKARLYFLDGFVNGQILDKVIGNFINITKEEMDKIISTDDFMQRYISGTEAILEDKIENIQTFHKYRSKIKDILSMDSIYPTSANEDSNLMYGDLPF